MHARFESGCLRGSHGSKTIVSWVATKKRREKCTPQPFNLLQPPANPSTKGQPANQLTVDRLVRKLQICRRVQPVVSASTLLRCLGLHESSLSRLHPLGLR
ncbi:hypothetical protein Fmac_012708 [Flemingia macrophylla]|uniref:Uncharacterized protein n=1 Tax=Flemingia macrophylla TaxID=520843 RepID=A0ABD1MR19_9FABA